MSGRASSGRPICEHCISIDVRDWARRGFLVPGQSFRWSWNFQGVPCGDISVHTEADAAILAFRSRESDDAEWRPVRQRVPIMSTPCNFGGQRAWFICTNHTSGQYCGRRVAVLYCTNGLFACRNCCGLSYASQNESLKNREIRRSRNIRTRLGGGPNLFDPFPERPRRMHRQTYSRLLAQGEEADAIVFGRLLSRQRALQERL